ncbi:endonuclease domain-containing protein [Methylobacter tundripaludum]|uniref:DUF559 domain-containing protein n=1 Tax=Methylobacter tundripaludum (strain ATCC BAA-1195 / DSM 17260 / SV96) TaxID=697282 RepID=G3IRM1_METTV|nr:endonuclease domain-containing protein [Methylobacter tundripaludum]EGW23640.1 protein of unknown function DUF559 [Methylobacter tundripaludum SV96]
MKPYNPVLKPFSRNLRSGMTDAEQLLWSKLRRKQILGLQFYRQKPLANYIVDFYCAAANLVIELDGSQHFEPDHQARDAERDRALESMGIMVLRFDNRQVLTELDAVMSVVFNVVEKQIKIQIPPPFAKGGVIASTSTSGFDKGLDSTAVQTQTTPQTSQTSPPFEKGGQGGFSKKGNSV